MAADITEEFQVDITAKNAVTTGDASTGITYDYSFNGMQFFSATTPDNPYRRQTAQYRKDQNDNSSEPGEQSLSGWWMRSQSSFHYGAGINFFEPAQEQGYVQSQTIRYRFADSQGVEVFNQGQVTLLRDVVASSHPVTATSYATLRSIPTGLLLHDGLDVDKVTSAGVATDFIDYASGAEPVYAICDDGKYAYWITNKTAGGSLKWHLFRKPLTGSAASTADEVNLAIGSGNVSSARIEYVKERLIATLNNVIYEIPVSDASSSASPRVIYTQTNSDFSYTYITESPSDVYVSGYQGERGVIFKLYTYTDNTTNLPVIGTAIVVAELPRGEVPHSIKYYLGYLVIGTNKGIRVAAVQGDGSIVYGPLLVDTEQPVYQIAVADSFAYCTTRIGGDTGLIKVDLSASIDNLVFPYANNLQAIGEQKTCTGVALVGGTDRLAFTSIGTSGKIFIESSSVLRSSGYIKTGKIRFNTTENKYFKYIKERAVYNGGSIGLSTVDSSIITVDNSNGNTDIAIPEKNGTENKQFIFTLNRDSVSTTVGPTLQGYQIKALPAAKRQRLIQYNVYCYDKEIDRYRNVIGYDGRAFERLSLFEDIESQSDIISVVDYTTGETFSALIEECSFTGLTSPFKRFSGFGGVLQVTVRKI